MKTIYEVMVNGSPVYNGTDGTKARAVRDEWIKGGRTVEFTAVNIPDVIEGEARAFPTKGGLSIRRVKAVRS